jgi:hypothetical protein
MIKYVGEQMGSLDKLKGKKIGLVYIDIAYGKEPIATLEKLSQKYGYTFLKYPVSAPGIEQSATWLQIRQQAAGLAVDVGLGGDELDRDGLGRIPDGSLHRRVVVGLRTRCRARGRGGGRLQIGDVPRRRAGLSGDQGHPQIRL